MQNDVSSSFILGAKIQNEVHVKGRLVYESTAMMVVTVFKG